MVVPMLLEAPGAEPGYNKMDDSVQARWQKCQAEEDRAVAAFLEAGGTFKERALTKKNKIPANYDASPLEEELAKALASASVQRLAEESQANNILCYLKEERVRAFAAQGGAGAAFLKAGGAVQEPAVMKVTGLSANYNVPRPKEECIMAFALNGGAGAAYLKAGVTPQEPAAMDMIKMSSMYGVSPRTCDKPFLDESTATSIVPDLDEDVTTVMFDVPCRLTQEQLMESMCDMGFADTFDFLYVPSGKKSNRGYAYVNFMSHKKAVAFGKALPGYTFPGAKNSMKRFTVKAADTQGKEANVLRNIQGKVLPYIRDPPAYVLQSWLQSDTAM